MGKLDFEAMQKLVTVQAQTGASIGAGAYLPVSKCWEIYCDVTLIYGADADCVITWYEADNVAGDNPVLMTEEFQIWHAVDIDTANALVRQDNAANFTIDTGDGKSQTVRFKIDPVQISEGKTAIAPSIGDSDAANIIHAEFHVVSKYDAGVSLMTDL
jgi:hypothetical protein